MPISHTVVFRLHHPADSDAEREFLAAAREALPAIPGVEDFRVHRQISPRSDLTHRFAMTFADDEAYQLYNDHPRHTAFVAERWGPEVADFQEYDFVID